MLFYGNNEWWVISLKSNTQKVSAKLLTSCYLKKKSREAPCSFHKLLYSPGLHSLENELGLQPRLWSAGQHQPPWGLSGGAGWRLKAKWLSSFSKLDADLKGPWQANAKRTPSLSLLRSHTSLNFSHLPPLYCPPSSVPYVSQQPQPDSSYLLMRAGAPPHTKGHRGQVRGHEKATYN